VAAATFHERLLGTEIVTRIQQHVGLLSSTGNTDRTVDPPDRLQVDRVLLGRDEIRVAAPYCIEIG
jgi:hypothetical protein